ncbi:MAG: hypothetical protein Q4E57_02485 [Eubacteriales bacterium]|nr:hypothetical protein [Eubacteriales bacterium]
MNHCKYCGKELVNGKCDCEEFKQANNKKALKEPFVVPEFNLNYKSFSGFVTSVRDMTGTTDATAVKDDPFEHNIPIVPDCIQPEENELVIKQYNIAKLRTRLRFTKAEGRLMITNRRVLFRATGTSLTGNIAQQHQFNIDEIGGVEIRKDYRFSLLNLIGSILLLMLTILVMRSKIFNPNAVNNAPRVIMWLILGFLSTAPTFFLYKRYLLKLFGAAVGTGCCLLAYYYSLNAALFMFPMFLAFIVFILDMIIVCFVPSLVINIKTKGALGAVCIRSRSMVQSAIGEGEYTGFAEVMPWDDTIMAMNEIGTMIDDIQKQGDYAVEKWTTIEH